jgi:hypothetical protein
LSFAALDFGKRDKDGPLFKILLFISWSNSLRQIAQRRQPMKSDGKINGFGVAALSALHID